MDSQKRGLGKGLASLIPIRKEEPTNQTGISREDSVPFCHIPLSSIVPNPHQPRKSFDQQKILELAASIREKGLLQPILVTERNGRFEIISGERRLRAAALAGLSEIPAVIREAHTTESLELALIENCQRQDLDPIEEASAYEELVKRLGYTQEEVSAKVGRDRATVGNMLRLLKLPSKIRQFLREGQLSMGHARALLGILETEKQIRLAERTIEGGWSVRELEAKVAGKNVLRLKGRQRHSLPLSPTLISLVDDLRRRLGTQIRIVPSGKKGKIIIEYYSDMDLDRLYRVLVK